MLIDSVMHAALCSSRACRHNGNATRRRDKVSAHKGLDLFDLIRSEIISAQ
jgi:hypothetical protein